MSLFDTLLLGHLAGDFLFQNAWMADGKKRRILPLLVHATVYTLCIFVFSMTAGFLSWMGYFIIWAAHIAIDSRKFTRWWVRSVMGVKVDSKNDCWLTIMVDQICHLLVIFIVILLNV